MRLRHIHSELVLRDTKPVLYVACTNANDMYKSHLHSVPLPSFLHRAQPPTMPPRRAFETRSFFKSTLPQAMLRRLFRRVCAVDLCFTLCGVPSSMEAPLVHGMFRGCMPGPWQDTLYCIYAGCSQKVQITLPANIVHHVQGLFSYLCSK